MAAAAETLLRTTLTSEQAVERLRRLELASGLLPAFHRVLDVRDIFDRVSAISQAAPPHDMLTLGDRADVSQMLIQPFVNYNLGAGLSSGLVSESTANWNAEGDRWACRSSFR